MSKLNNFLSIFNFIIWGLAFEVSMYGAIKLDSIVLALTSIALAICWRAR